MVDTFACTSETLPRLMGARAIAYVVAGNSTSVDRAAAVANRRDRELSHLVVVVVDAAAFTTLDSRNSLAAACDHCVLFRVDGGDQTAFAHIDAVGGTLIAMQAPPTAPAVIVSFDSSYELVEALARWLASTSDGSDDAAPDPTVVAEAALHEHSLSSLEQAYVDLLDTHREQAMLLSDLRLEYNELSLRDAQLRRDHDDLLHHDASLVRERDALAQDDHETKAELAALRATKLFRYTAGLRGAYATVRRFGRRRP